jgi:UDP-glucose 4-epimerase
MGMRMVVTGGTGFIGSHVAERLVEAGHAVLAIDNYATSRRDTLADAPPRLTVVEADIAGGGRTMALIQEFRPDVVLHAAASYKDPEDWDEDVRTNVRGTIHVIRAARAVGVRRLIYFQTALCYGSRPVEQPVTLAAPVQPENSYAISKTAGERYIALSGLEFVSLRLANIYGARNLSGPIPTFYSRLAAGKRCFAVDTRRDFIHVDDLTAAVVPFAEGRGAPGYYHVASGRDYAIRELYDAVARAMAVTQPVEERARGADDAPTILLDPSRLQAELGWKPTVPLEDGIRRAVAWYRRHGVEQTYTHLKLKD